MPNKVLNSRIAFKIDTAANWKVSTLVLLSGEIGIESDTRKFKIGDGRHVYSELQYSVSEAANDTQYMYIANYDTDSDGSVDKADTIKNGTEYISVDDTTEDGLWTARKIHNNINSLSDDVIHKVEKGSPGGVATLNGEGLIPVSQLPSYVDDVLEFDSIGEFPETGETGKIYVAKDTNLTFRWSGTQYTEISASIALGETESTAYAGNKGKANAEAITTLQDRFNVLVGSENDEGSLRALAYKDTVVDADIENVNVSKLFQDENAILLISCGDASSGENNEDANVKV